MADTGEQHVAEIQENLACPACEYNLRGLRGAVVQCPECGATCDVAKLVTNRWRKPWHRAPKLNVISMPTAVAVLGLIVIIGFVVRDAWRGGLSNADGAAILCAMAIHLVVWLLAMWRAYRVFDDMKGCMLAVLGHALLVGYLGSIVLGLVGLSLMFGGGGAGVIGGLFIVALGTGLLWICRRGEKFVAGQCIQRYLEQQAAT